MMKTPKFSTYGVCGGGDWGAFDSLQSQLVRSLLANIRSESFADLWEISIGWYRGGPISSYQVTPNPKIRMYKKRKHIDCMYGFKLDDIPIDDLDLKQYIGERIELCFHAICSRLKEDKVVFDEDVFRSDVEQALVCFLASQQLPNVGNASGEIHRRLRRYLDDQELARITGETVPPDLQVGNGYRLIPDPVNSDRVIWLKIEA